MSELKMRASPSPGVRYAKNGMVASSSTLAASAGVSVLQRGGNAFDAAIAVAGVEWIDLPAQCGLGGDVFTVFYDAKSDRVGASNGSGESARAASRARCARWPTCRSATKRTSSANESTSPHGSIQSGTGSSIETSMPSCTIILVNLKINKYII